MDMQTQHYIQDDLLVVQSMQDCQPILDSCKARADAGATGSKDVKHAASFPMAVIESYCNRLNITFQEWLQNDKHIKSMLNDKDLSGFRIWQEAV